ncbi:hypothetical protein OCH239_13780 [Roseivivax halodurans JCM 10272]|uniref:Uncharacterized protein n=1 Tax=Roseivivax halodurans JCM 10272 TaxID=1449350 RepID=X7EHV1_9RHOB|nr:hypothetical protein OCH239_13780 [Roseivivax halodurans JCM 10272]
MKVDVVERMIAKRFREPIRFINHGGAIRAVSWPTKERFENDLAIAAMKRDATRFEW